MMKKTFLILSCFISACNVIPDYQRPTVEMPAQWHFSTLEKSTVELQWWRNFKSSELNHLMTESLLFNKEISAAQHRIEQARAQAKLASSSLFPTVNAQLGISANHNGEQQLKSLQIPIAYEVDLWGANRAQHDVGQILLNSEICSKDALQLIVMSNVAQNYFNLLALVERERIAKSFLANAENVLHIIESRYRVGAVSSLDVMQQKTELANAKANVVFLTQQITLSENSLTILLGHPPQSHRIYIENFYQLKLPDTVSIPPVDLLERRPDIKQIEMELVAANANLGIARAAFYPKLKLDLTTLLASPQPLGIVFNTAANLTQPIFQAGKLEAGEENSKAKQAELVEIYKKTILIALREVEDSAAIYQYANQRFHALNEAADKAKTAYELSLNRYQFGAVDYQTVLNTQNALLTAQNNQVQARLETLNAITTLYQALGGGWHFSL